MKLGCNYWASHAGLKMWERWEAETVVSDFELLSQWGINVIRVFPIWPEFQKLEPIYGGGGKLLEIRGSIVDKEVEKLKFVIKEAHSRGMEVIVSLVNGWMSGRLFVPAPFYNRNVLTDPEAIRYQAKYVDSIVEQLGDYDGIIGWDLGNECNVMGEVNDRNQAWLWMNSIYTAIKAKDSKRPVYAGMHGLGLDGKWTIKDVADNCDIMTTHPYPLFTPHCGKDPLGEGKSIYQAAAECRFYSDISQKPCIIEELGTLGPNVVSDEKAAIYLKKVLDSAVAEGIETVLWWCAFDQPFNYHPYDSITIERELGLFTYDKKPKPVAHVIKDYKEIVSQKREVDGLCMLTEGQDHWLTAYGSYVLSSRNGLEIEFSYDDDEIPESKIYMMACIKGFNVIKKRTWDELKEKVKAGAILYISYDGGFLSEFEEVTGITVTERKGELSSSDEFIDSKILHINDYGMGKVIFCKNPIENECILNDEFPIKSHDEVYKTIRGYRDG